MIGPLFSTKSIWMALFFWIPVWQAPFFWHPGIFRDFSRLLILLVLHELTDICVITSKKWVQKVNGQYMNRSTFWMIKYMNGSIFSKARYMNWVGFEILARTTVPKLPRSYTPPPPPPSPEECWVHMHFFYLLMCLKTAESGYHSFSISKFPDFSMNFHYFPDFFDG